MTPAAARASRIANVSPRSVRTAASSAAAPSRVHTQVMCRLGRDAVDLFFGGATHATSFSELLATPEPDAASLGIDARQYETIIVAFFASNLDGVALALEAQPVTDDLDYQKSAAVTLGAADNTAALGGAVGWAEGEFGHISNPHSQSDFELVRVYGLVAARLRKIECQGDLPNFLVGIASEMLRIIDARIARLSTVHIGEIPVE